MARTGHGDNRFDTTARLLCAPLCLLALVLATGCAHRVAEQDLDPDPWEGVNRKVFAFNNTVDAYAVRPAARAYLKVTPDWLNQGFNRFFANLSDLRSSINGMLQWRWSIAGQNLTRFTINSTLGVGGFFDVASEIDLARSEQDFGVTLARWGVASGPYIVMPLMGPGTLRSTAGRVPDYWLWLPSYLEDDVVSYGLTALSVLDERARLLSMEDAIVGDRYSFLRDIWLQNRRSKLGLAPQEDDFGEGFEPAGDEEW
jgi:phospholipid-binding lipoprotein MlaA